MKEVSVSTEAWQCEACGRKHTIEWHGKWSIFHCPEHGEFCNTGLNTCGIFRYSEFHKREVCSCPICGWVAIEERSEVYDNRIGKEPETEKEKQSFLKEQDKLISYPHGNSGYSSYKRINKHIEKMSL